MKSIVLTYSPTARDTIRQLFRRTRSGIQPRVIASYDDYSHGPLLRLGTTHDFFLQRNAFWKSLDLCDADRMYEFDLADAHISMLNAFQISKKAEIWVTNSVQDMFYASVILHLLEEEGIDTSNTSMRHFGGQNVKLGMAQPNIDILEVLFNSSVAVPVDPSLYRDGWTALSLGSSAAIKSFIDEHDPSTPLVSALSAYLLRFSEFNDGLGSIDRALLRAGTDEMRQSVYTVGRAIFAFEPDDDHLLDLILFRRLVDLSRVSPDPWFRMEGDTRVMRNSFAQITDSGKEARAKYSIQPF